MAASESKPHTWGISPIAFDGTRTPLKTALFVIVCLAWLLPGLVGHDPWKTDEAMAFGAVAEILSTGDWTQFRIAGEPLLGEPPLFLWTAALLGKLLGEVGIDALDLAGLRIAERDRIVERELADPQFLVLGDLEQARLRLLRQHRRLHPCNEDAGDQGRCDSAI